MEERVFDKDKLVQFWTDSSDDDFDTMLSLHESKKFNWALFVGHLMIEKLLKAVYLKTHKEYPPHLHNLLRLAEKCNLDLTEDQKIFLATVTAFNINARYDDYKMSFQQKCTPEFTEIWINKLIMNREWIKKLLG